MPSLTLIKAPGGTASVEPMKLDGQLMIIGRSPEECQIIIQSNAVSRKHAQIHQEQSRYYIEDLNSRNGTEVNGKNIKGLGKVLLKDQDRIKICDFLFRFQDEQAPKASAMPVLPEGLRKRSSAAGALDQREEAAEDAQSTVEGTFARMPNQQLLESQPAERLRAVLDISALLGKALHVDELLPKIADSMFHVFRQADRCFVIMRDENTEQLIPKVIKVRRGQPGSGDRFSRTIVRKCLETQQAFLSEDASSDSSLGMAQSIADFRIRSVMCVPLVTQDGKSLGVIQLDSSDRSKKFHADDVKLLIGVANQATVALENARLHESLIAKQKQEQETAIAREVQRGFLPQRSPDVPGYEFFAHYEAAHTVGGDYYDFIPLPDGRLVAMLGDVSGKGVPAALLMAKLGGIARACILTNPDLGQAISALNDNLLESNLNDRYVTLTAALLDPTRNELTIVNAGHMIPLLYRPQTGELVDSMEDKGGFPIGWVPGFPYEAQTIPLASGECYLVFTDGVTDAENNKGARFGMEGVREALFGQSFRPGEVLTPKVIGERIINAVRAHIGSHPQFDDIALVCFGRVDDDATRRLDDVRITN